MQNTNKRLEDFNLITPCTPFWVFGYGSLMWNPGFDFVQQRPARAHGYHRAFAMRSVRHRGTPARPGLVLTLCPGGSCTGRAFQVAREGADMACAYLLDREIGSYAYRPAWIRTTLGPALTFLPQAGAAQYVPRLTQDQQAAAIAFAVGGMGPNPEYLRKTITEMQKLHLPTKNFEALENQVLRLREGP